MFDVRKFEDRQNEVKEMDQMKANYIFCDIVFQHVIGRSISPFIIRLANVYSVVAQNGKLYPPAF